MVTVRYTNAGLGGANIGYASAGAAGADVQSAHPHPIVIRPGERVLVPTGLRLEIPEGYEAQVRPRSGLALKHGLTVLNSPGTIDSDYRGEVKVLLVNLGNVDVTINYGTRIAQLVFAKVERVQLDYTYSGVQAVNPLSETQRGEGGFGSTGTAGASASASAAPPAAGEDTTTTEPSTLRHCC